MAYGIYWPVVATQARSQYYPSAIQMANTSVLQEYKGENIYTDHLLSHWYRHAQPTRAKAFVPDEICNDVATSTNLV